MPPLKSDEARTDFYTVYKRESTEYDTNYVKKYDEDLNTTLIFVRLSNTLVLGTVEVMGVSRLACFRLSAHRSSSTSKRNSNRIRTT